MQAVHIQYRPTSNGRSSIRVDYKLEHSIDYSNLACIDLRGLGTTIIKDTTIVTDIQSGNEIYIRITTHTNGECGGSICSGDIALDFSSSIPLAISLSKFEGTAINNNAILSWTTLSESETVGYEIERSKEGIKWEKVGFIDAQSEDGFSQQALDYEFMDMNLLGGNYFYRLKEITFNHSSTLSKVVSVFIDHNITTQLEVYPNPAQSIINISANDKKAFSYQLIDAMGREVTYKVAFINHQLLDVSSLNAGIYQLIILDDQGNYLETKRIIKR